MAEAKKNPTLLLGDIHKHVLDKAAESSDRRQDVLHPSEMAKADWCPRQSYYRISGTPQSEKTKSHSAQLETIFGEGNEIHSKWQTWAQEVDPQFKPEFKVQAGLIHGSADGVSRGRGGYALEIKSIGLGTLRFEDAAILKQHNVETVDGKKIYDLEAIWKGIRRPLPSHLRQLTIYLYCLQYMGEDITQGVFLYEYKPTQASKEFVVKYNHEIMEPILEKVATVEESLRTDTPPERPETAGRTAKVCKECPWLTTCLGKDTSVDDNPATDQFLADAGNKPRRRSGLVLPGDADASPAPVRGADPAGRPDRPRRRSLDVTVR
jgi:CRISPR/Cas system-associated exonuclease Cas4 (RecB family)